MIDAPLSIEEALAHYDRESARQRLEVASAQRHEILVRFPLEDWPSLPLERYAAGTEQSEDSFCRWVEFRSNDLGRFSGGSAHKLVIFHRRTRDEWVYPAGFESVHEAWGALRDEFVRAFELANEDRWEKIEDLALLGRGSALRLKSLHVYFPEKIFPIYSRDHLQHFLVILDPAGEIPKGALERNRRLIEVLREGGRFEGWTNVEIMFFLYSWRHPNETPRAVKIAPGRNASEWSDCHLHGYICVGWDEVGDLGRFEDRDAFREEFARHYPYNGSKGQVARKANELWTLMELEPGDLVIANDGTRRVVGVGRVGDGGYRWADERDSLRHTLQVDWDQGLAQEIPQQKAWATVTVKKVPVELMERILHGGQEGAAHESAGVTSKVVSPVVVPPMLRSIADSLVKKGQVLLYGPPGTGKTYHARQFAVWWLNRHEAGAGGLLSDPARFARAENELTLGSQPHRNWVLVANPKEWSWDRLASEGTQEFRYGRLKRNYPHLQPGDRVFGYQSTPDKRFLAVAKVTRGLSSEGSGEPTIAIEHVATTPQGPNWEELQADPVLRESEPIRFRFQGTLFALTDPEARRLCEMLDERMPGVVDEEGEEVGRLTRVTFHPSYGYEHFVEGFRPVRDAGAGMRLELEDGIFKRVCRAAQADPEREYLILIDEFNRANVAKVMGELLTLLEMDKRGLTVRLPQSKEVFSVPKNVFLLGTMNTADRSIKLLDAALRRRFAFQEMMPNLELLIGSSVGELELDQFLGALNARIASREGREKQIGHSYLLEEGQPLEEPEEFQRRFVQEILPLLQEYCYDDYGILREYIGKALVDVEGQSLVSEALEDPDTLIEHLARHLGQEEVAEE